MVQVTSSLPRFTIGLDLGDRRSAFCVVDAEGKVVRRNTVATDRDAFERAFGRFAGARVVLEASTHSPWAAEHLATLGLESIVANPRTLPVPRGRDKSDTIDAEFLARLGRADVALLRPVQHRPIELRKTMLLVKTRASLVEARTLLINSIRGQLKSLDGIRLPKCSTSKFTTVARESVPGLFDEALASIDSLTANIRVFDRKIEQLAQSTPSLHRLTQVMGVGPLTALTFMGTIHDPHRFRRNRSVGAYLGLVPRRFQSGDSDPQLSISKRGDPYMRRLLVTAAHYILGPLNKVDSDLRRFGLAMAGDGRDRKKKRKAIVAVARRLAVLLIALWRSGEDYDPLRNANREQPMIHHRLIPD